MSKNSFNVIFILFVSLILISKADRCGGGCSNCTSQTECTICATKFFLKNGTCFECPRGCDTCILGS